MTRFPVVVLVGLVVLVALGVCLAPAAADDPLVVRTYDVGALTEPAPSVHAEAFGLPPPPETPDLWPEADEEEGGDDVPPFLSADALLELIRASVRPAAWDQIEGSALRSRGARLEVVAPADLHAEVEKFLARLWAEAGRRVTLAAHWVEIEGGDRPPAGSDAARGALLEAVAAGRLDASTLAALLEEARRPGNRHSSASTVIRPGAWTCLCQADRVSYVRDYDVEIAQASRVGDPIIGYADDGWAVDARAFPLSDGRVWVDVLAQQSDVELPIRLLGLEAEPFGSVDLPAAHVVRVATAAALASGETFATAVRSPERPDVLQVFLLSATVTAGEAAAGGSPRRLDLAALVRESPEIRIARRPHARGGAAPGLARPEEFEDPPSLNDWIERLRQEVEPAAWQHEGSWITGHGDGLFLNADRAVLERAATWVGAQERQSLRTVRMRWMLSESLDGGAWREVGAAALDLPLGHVACMAAGVERSYVADWDVEVAQEARSGDPIVGTAFGGLWMNLRADAAPSENTFLLHVEHALQRLDRRFEVRRPGNEVTGVFETPRVQVGMASRDLVLERGVPTTLDLGGADGRRLRVDLVLGR